MLQLNIDQCFREEADALSEWLEEMGALSVTFMDKYDTPILEPEIGTTPLWSDVVIQALFENESDVDSILFYLAAQHPHLQVQVETIPETDWETVCKADFKPQRFGDRLWITPSWLTPPDPEAINLTLDPGLAFGTGNHATTALCLTWLERAALNQKRIIDYGCGSGILGLAALKLGASHVDAIDLDEQALIATRNNAILNHVSERELSIALPDAQQEPADIVIANILLTPLLQLKQVFHNLIKSKGVLVVSGLLKDQVDQLLEAYQPDFSHREIHYKEEWCLIVFDRV